MSMYECVYVQVTGAYQQFWISFFLIYPILASASLVLG